MADLTLTAKNIRPLIGSNVIQYAAGGTGNLGDLVYVAADGDVEQADADAAGSAQAAGMVVSIGGQGATTFAAGDEVGVCVFGRVSIKDTSVTPGALAYVSTNVGKIETAAPAGSSGDYLWIVGRFEYVMDESVLFINPWTPDTAAQ